MLLVTVVDVLVVLLVVLVVDVKVVFVLDVEVEDPVVFVLDVVDVARTKSPQPPPAMTHPHI